MSLNTVSLQGRLTADPELYKTEGGTARTSIRLAVNRDYKNADGNYEADFITCSAWRGTAEFICRNFKKGQMVNVTGRLEVRSWVDRDGGKHEISQVLIRDIYFCDSKRAASNSDTQEPAGYEEIPEGEQKGELPF